MADVVRVLRIVEIVGDREAVEAHVNHELQNGTHLFRHGRVQVRVATIGNFPEILSNHGVQP